MSRPIYTLLGIGFLILSALYFIRPGIWGTHLTGTHTILHLLTGIVILWAGLRGSHPSAALTSAVFGVLYITLGIAGFANGVWALPSPGVPGPGNDSMWVIFEGTLELGERDHIVHLAAGAAFLVAAGIGIASRKPTSAGSNDRTGEGIQEPTGG